MTTLSLRPHLAAIGLALAALACPSRAQESPFDWTIFQPGGWPAQYIGVPVPAAEHATWLALVAGAHRWTLEPAAQDWRDAHDGVNASRPGTLVFLRHPALQAGPAPTPEMRFSGRLRRFGPGTPPLHIAFGSDDYEVSVNDRAVWIRQGERRMKIGVADDTSEAFDVDVVWAGDLDRDGRLDLITRENNGGYSSDLCLYLSSPPHAVGEPLVKVGCEDWSG